VFTVFGLDWNPDCGATSVPSLFVSGTFSVFPLQFDSIGSRHVIAYHILCHDNFPQVAKLLDALYSADDVFLIDVDDGNSPNTTAIERFMSRENVHINHDKNIGWGGAGSWRCHISQSIL